MMRDYSKSSPLEAAMTRGLASLSEAVDRAMQRNATQPKRSKPNKSTAQVCKPVDSVQYSATGD